MSLHLAAADSSIVAQRRAGVNRQGEEFGEEWIGRIHAEDRERVLAEYAAGMKTGEVSTQFGIRRRDSGALGALGCGRVYCHD